MESSKILKAEEFLILRKFAHEDLGSRRNLVKFLRLFAVTRRGSSDPKLQHAAIHRSTIYCPGCTNSGLPGSTNKAATQ